jgi:hypothetical protein
MLLVVGDGHIIGIDRNHLYAPCDNASPGSSSKVKRAQHQRKQQQLQIEREVCCRGLTTTYSYVRRWLCLCVTSQKIAAWLRKKALFFLAFSK